MNSILPSNTLLVIKQWQVNSAFYFRGRPCSDDGPAVSAFAARKAARRPIGEVMCQNEAQTSLGSKTYIDPLEGSKPPRKKQKRESRRSPRPSQQIDGLVNVQGGSLQDGMKDIESGSDSNSSSDDELEAGAQSMPPIQRLSTFDLSRSKVLSETETEWTVRLHPNDVSIQPIPYCTLQDLRFT